MSMKLMPRNNHKIVSIFIILYLTNFLQLESKPSKEKTQAVKLVESKINLEREISKIIVDSIQNKITKAVYLSLYQKNQMVLEIGEILERDTPTPIASITKPFTAFGILKLVELGVFKLSDPISRYIPELQEYKDFKAGEEILIQDLLQHTSGIPYEGNSVMLKIKIGERQFNIPNQTDQAGKRFIYSNHNYRLLAKLVEQATGQSMAEYLKEILFEPLGIVDYNLDFYDGASGLAISPVGLSRFANMILAKGEWEGQRLISLRIWKHFLKRPRKNSSKSPNYYGIGWTIQKKGKKIEILAHNGRGEYSYSMLKIYPDTEVVTQYFAIQTKNSPQKFESLNRQLEQKLEKYYSYLPKSE